MNSNTDVAIIGAGPYGLSLAAHLERRGVAFRIFGPPMQVWRAQMPAGMRLKSDGFASDLYDPDRRFTLRRYCEDRGIAYADYGLPVRLDTFVAYALDFQKDAVPMLEPVSVTEVHKAGERFEVRLESGEIVAAQTVVMATGICFYGHIPEPLSGLPRELCTHSSAHHDLSALSGRRVVVVGGGSSASDLAALLHQAGASVQLVARSQLEFHLPPKGEQRSIWKRISEPNLGLGPGLKSALYTALPGLFRLLPSRVRQRIVRRHLGPAGGWFMKDEVVGKVPVHSGYEIAGAESRGQGVMLRLSDRQGKTLELDADHVISATGYQVSVPRLTILHEQLRAAVRLEAETQSPILSPTFQSSVAGLYFIGVTSANSFGPVMRFARGAEYTANRLGSHLGRLYSHRSLASHIKAASS